MNDPQPHTETDEAMIRWFKGFLNGVTAKEHHLIKEVLEAKFAPSDQQAGYRADHEKYINQVKDNK